MLFTCELNDCGPAYSRSAWGRFNGLFTAADGDPRYLAAKLTTAKGTAYVALMVGRQRSQVDIVEVSAMQGDMVVADAAALAQGIERDGKVSVYGIYFDTDKADIKAESKPTLDDIAKLLKNRADLKLFVVGHTDITGAFAHNRSLSEARARAVVTALVGDYKIDSARLEVTASARWRPPRRRSDDSRRARHQTISAPVPMIPAQAPSSRRLFEALIVSNFLFRARHESAVVPRHPRHFGFCRGFLYGENRNRLFDTPRSELV
jgi:outer membrane protein OmpA-like peptidoglycan-associated protein